MAELLRVESLSAGYGDARVISRLDLVLEEGKSLALLGRNGVGKTTLLNSIIGVTTRHAGRILLGTQDLTVLPPHARARCGIGWAPQERNIFRSLTVEENLTAIATPGPWNVEKIYAVFPRLRERRRVPEPALATEEPPGPELERRNRRDLERLRDCRGP